MVSDVDNSSPMLRRLLSRSPPVPIAMDIMPTPPPPPISLREPPISLPLPSDNATKVDTSEKDDDGDTLMTDRSSKTAASLVARRPLEEQLPIPPAPPSDKNFEFEEGEIVLCQRKGAAYKARVLQRSGDEYRIHFKGWNRKWDEWVPANRLQKLKNNSQQTVKDRIPSKNS